MSGIPPDSGRRVRREVTPIGVHSRYREGIPDIFIPPTQNGNAEVMRGRNENSGMTTGGRQGAEGAKRRFARRIPKRRLGTMGDL